MNAYEKQSIREIEMAKTSIKRAKIDFSYSSQHMNTLTSFIESNIKVDSLKNIRSEIDKYKKRMVSNNETLDAISRSLDSKKSNIEKQAIAREEAERKEKERIENEKKELAKKEKEAQSQKI